MTVYDRAWLRDARRAVRGAVAAVPHLRREARKRRNYAPIRAAWAGGRPVIPCILAGIALAAPPESALNAVMLWSLAILLLRAGDLRGGLAGQHEAGVLAPMPVTDAWVFSFHSAAVVRTSLWLLADFAAVYAVLGWKMHLPTTGWAVLASAAVVQWLAALGAAALLLRLFPRVPFSPAGTVVGYLLAFTLMARDSETGRAVFSAAATALGPLTPAGWLHAALSPAVAGEWSPRLWFAAPALALIALLPWQRRALAARYRFRAELAGELDSAGGSEDEALAGGQSADAPRAPTLAGTRALLDETDWVRSLSPVHRGPIEFVVLRWLTTRERVVLDTMLAAPAAWTGEWRRAWIGTAVATLAALIAHRYRPEALPLVFGLGAWIAAGMAAPLGGGGWAGFSSAFAGQRACAMCALLPAGMAEVGRVILKANIVRAGAALPHFVLYGAVGGALFLGDPLGGALLGFKAWLLFLALLPAMPILKYSPHTNDTSSGFLRSGALIIAGGVLGAPILGLGFVVFYWPVLDFAALPLIALLSWVSWRSYRAAAEKGAFDLLA